MVKPNGFVLYKGRSHINGEPIVAIATGLHRKSKNPKTGPSMVSVYILADTGMSVLETAFSGRDVSICGTCIHRPKDGKLGSCYPDLGKGPQQVYRNLLNGGYPKPTRRKALSLLRERNVRFGAYGDPAALPLELIEQVCEVVASWSAYTHQWRTCNPAYARFCMASCETEGQRLTAVDMGYRTFRVRLSSQPLMKDEFVCPASIEGGKRLTCEQCRACNGTANGSKQGGKNASPAIFIHGIAWKIKKYTENVKSLPSSRLSLTLL